MQLKEKGVLSKAKVFKINIYLPQSGACTRGVRDANNYILATIRLQALHCKKRLPVFTSPANNYILATIRLQDLYCKKRSAVFPSPAEMSPIKLSLAGNH
jgi:hypothetical protein